MVMRFSFLCSILNEDTTESVSIVAFDIIFGIFDTRREIFDARREIFDERENQMY